MDLVVERDTVKQAALAGAAAALAAVSATVAAASRIFGPSHESVSGSDTEAQAELLRRLDHADPSSSESFMEVAKCVARAADSKDNYTSGHSERVAAYALRIGRELNLPAVELDELRLAGLLHDIGKLGVRSSLLNKPSRLTEAERREMNEHARRGADIVRSSAKLAGVLPGVELHHESWDGSGYPYGLHGDNIPLMARIIAVADAFDAMTSARPYQEPLPAERAAERIANLAGRRFCPRTAAAFSAVFRRDLKPQTVGAVVASAPGIPLPTTA